MAGCKPKKTANVFALNSGNMAFAVFKKVVSQGFTMSCDSTPPNL